MVRDSEKEDWTRLVHRQKTESIIIFKARPDQKKSNYCKFISHRIYIDQAFRPSWKFIIGALF